jgi:hypothetical protein
MTLSAAGARRSGAHCQVQMQMQMHWQAQLPAMLVVLSAAVQIRPACGALEASDVAGLAVKISSQSSEVRIPRRILDELSTVRGHDK